MKTNRFLFFTVIAFFLFNGCNKQEDSPIDPAPTEINKEIVFFKGDRDTIELQPRYIAKMEDMLLVNLSYYDDRMDSISCILTIDEQDNKGYYNIFEPNKITSFTINPDGKIDRYISEIEFIDTIISYTEYDYNWETKELTFLDFFNIPYSAKDKNISKKDVSGIDKEAKFARDNINNITNQYKKGLTSLGKKVHEEYYANDPVKAKMYKDAFDNTEKTISYGQEINNNAIPWYEKNISKQTSEIYGEYKISIEGSMSEWWHIHLPDKFKPIKETATRIFKEFAKENKDLAVNIMKNIKNLKIYFFNINIKTLDAEMITHFGANLRGEITGKNIESILDNCVYGFCISQEDEKPTITNTILKPTKHSFEKFSYYTNPIQPGTKYYVRAYLTYNYGNDKFTKYGDTKSFETSGIESPNQIFDDSEWTIHGFPYPGLTEGCIALFDSFGYGGQRIVNYILPDKRTNVGSWLWSYEQNKIIFPYINSLYIFPYYVTFTGIVYSSDYNHMKGTWIVEKIYTDYVREEVDNGNFTANRVYRNDH